MADESAVALRCIECSNVVPSLYQEYSPGNIKLTRCDRCHCYADEYVEHEMMVVWIDLVLHRERAYRHLLFNVPLQHRQNLKGYLWKSTIAILLLDSGKRWLHDHKATTIFDGPIWPTLSSFFRCFLTELVLGTLPYTAVILLLVHHWKLAPKRRWLDVLLAVHVSSFFKLFAIPMLIWRFERAMVVLLDFFVLTSNVTALKVLLETSYPCAGTLVICASLLHLPFNGVSWYASKS
ncbi:hypothetical protein KFL_001150035 [Klebsormidium nitens]|uniref:Protein ARV n=1 Tax=Klebsormidium nitens TaxID=105231 RepID=A0A1Y1HWK6_KLENI|nr:hypothetical protein KFL_001150035 [Klebsormidium nitens]|eukprot:GAQ82543.1 hypothetical protein KFL_001150035 [Klebsormidium nitens]